MWTFLSEENGESVPPMATGGQQTQIQIPYYDEVVLQAREQELQLELKENVVYVPVR